MKVVQLDTAGPPGDPACPNQPAASGWRAITRVLRSTTNDLVTTFFPSDCRLCGGPLLALSHVPVCEACAETLRAHAATDQACTRCGELLPYESFRFAASLGSAECTMCRLAPPDFDRAVAFATYDNQVRETLHLLKFNRMHRLARALLAEGMATAIARLQPDAATDIVVIPVPLFASREKERGFNQARLLAEAALTLLRTTHPDWHLDLRLDLLTRARDTNASFAMDPRTRRKNLAGAFRVPNAEAKSTVKNREILLIDDILTTGATARECARTLKRAGAAKVWVATFARAQEDQVLLETGIARWDSPTPRAPNPEARQTF